jgi:ribonucleoside-diphosphate reductase alpha chain
MNKELLEYFNNDELASDVWLNKYAQENDITPNDMHRRLAKEFAKVESKYIEKEKNYYEDASFNLEIMSDYALQRIPLTEEKIFDMFKDFKYIVPQGRIMASLGYKEGYRSLSNCLRLPPPKDSYSSIMYTDTMLISAAKRGCGYGLGISNIRPKGIEVKNASSTSTGPVSFMSRYSNSTREVAQDGRRGACLLDIDINHPDSLDFINSKIDRTMITGANISVKTRDKFFEAVKNDEDYILRFPCDINSEIVECQREDLEYNTLTIIQDSSLDFKIYAKKIRAKEYFDAIVQNAWENAEPGLFFWDRVINYDPSSVYSKYFIDGTNACGEQPMAVYDTCRLILLNLFNMVQNPFTEEAVIDYDLLYKITYEMMRQGDNLVDLEIEYIERILLKIESDNLPEEEKAIEKTLWLNVKDIAESGRRVGCGITALGDMLAALNLKFDSEVALDTVELVMHTKMKAELDCSIDLAILRGPFKGWDKNLEFTNIFSDKETQGANDFYQMLIEEFPEQKLRMMKYGRRNVNWNTIAPAGTTSIMTQTTSGCEPLFMPFYTRRKKVNPGEEGVRIDFIDQNKDSWTEYSVLHPKFKDWMIIQIQNEVAFDVNPLLKGTNKTKENAYLYVKALTKDSLELYFKVSPWYGSTANDIDWTKRVKMQSILQKYTTSAISSTINLPNTVTKEEVANIYMKSWEMGLKGVTVYRDGCRTGVLVNTDIKDEVAFKEHDAIKRPRELEGEAFISHSQGHVYKWIVGLLNNKPYEVFLDESEGKFSGPGIIYKKTSNSYFFKQNDIFHDITCNLTNEQALLLRLTSISLRHGVNNKYIVEQLNKGEGDITSFSKSLARVLKKYIPKGETSTLECDNCKTKGSVVFEEGCSTCKECGHSKCG